ncbi:hypothetical protein A2U01_0077883, partial [Trifolium medium]|nr:hypothetical protein [Trifolium medium]
KSAGNAKDNGSVASARHHMDSLRGPPGCMPLRQYSSVLRLDQVWAHQEQVSA